MFLYSVNGGQQQTLKGAGFAPPVFNGLMTPRRGMIGGLPYTLRNTMVLRQAGTAQTLPVVTSLFHFDTVDGSGNFIDQIAGHGVSSSGTRSTSSPKFGAASALMGSAQVAALFAMNAQDILKASWCIEGWIKTSSSNRNWLRYQCGVSDAAVSTDNNGAIVIQGASAAVLGTLSFGGYTNGTWSHRAIVRNRTTIKTYKDGVEQDSLTVSIGDFLYNNGGSMDIFFGGATFDGNQDETRVTNLGPVYTGNFTPPTAPFPNP